jgi:uncharacterized protein (TIGR00730 family)
MGKGLAKLGYRCVHGGGKSGVMGNVTSGAQSEQGSVYGVVHEMFCVDNGEDERLVAAKGGGLLIVGGPNLVERKCKLVDSADCIVVLPGGVGTLEELCETVSAKSLGLMGLKHKGICVLNVDGFFDGWLAQMERSYRDGLLYGPVSSFFDLVSTPEEAIEWCVKQLSKQPSADTGFNADTNGSRMFSKEGAKDNKMPQPTSSDITVIRGNRNFVYSFVVGLTLGALGVMLLRRK